MIGNVREWTEDCVHENYVGAPTDEKPWISGDCSKRGIRGGSWSTTPQKSRPAKRGKANARIRVDTIGFRLAQSLP